MNEKEIGVDKTLYEQQESKLSEQSAAFIELLTKRGILEDARIDDDRVRQAKKEKKKNMYHNTFLLLQHYRSILWTLECFPANVAEELDRPLQDLDTLLDRLDLELGLNNRKLESRMESIRRSRLLVDRLNEAVSILKTKPVNGHMTIVPSNRYFRRCRSSWTKRVCGIQQKAAGQKSTFLFRKIMRWIPSRTRI